MKKNIPVNCRATLRFSIVSKLSGMTVLEGSYDFYNGIGDADLQNSVREGAIKKWYKMANVCYPSSMYELHCVAVG